MPNSINIPTPPALTGTDTTKIQQLHTYIFRLAEQLAMILNSIEAGSGGQAALQSTGSTDIYAVRNQLKEQLVNTSNAIRKEISTLGQEIDDVETGLSKDIEDLESSLGKEIDAITLPALGIRRGMASTTNALAGGQFEDITVNFDALPSVPVVVAGLMGSSGDGEHGGSVSCRVLAGSVTVNSFIVRVTSSTGQTTAHNYSVAWIAAI